MQPFQDLYKKYILPGGEGNVAARGKKGICGNVCRQGHDVRYRHVTPRGQVWDYGGICAARGKKGVSRNVKIDPRGVACL